MQRPAILITAALALSACDIVPGGVALQGEPPTSFIATRFDLPLLIDVAASATVISPGVGATAGHAAGYAMVGESTHAPGNWDLAFFKTGEGPPLLAGTPHQGEHVTAYGNSVVAGARQASGTIIVDVAGQCAGTPDQGDQRGPVAAYCHSHGYGQVKGFAFDADIGPGFSGGPVLNDKGQWIGITVGYVDLNVGPGGRYAFAYWAGDVLEQAKASAAGSRVAAGTKLER